VLFTHCPSYPADALLLTPELLVQVLALVNQKDRLSSCALVSTAWHAAAVAATSKVVLTARTPDHLDSMLLYLRQHGAYVRNILIFKTYEAAYLSQLQSLPSSCIQLQELQISACNEVNLPSVLSDLTNLTRLDMSDSGFLPAAPAGLMPLSIMTALQHLNCRLREPPSFWAPDVCFPAGVLSHLVNLTHLEVAHCKVDAPALAGTQRLTNLRECSLSAPGGNRPSNPILADMRRLVTPEAVAAVFVLQQLSLVSISSARTVSSATAPGLSTLTSLRDLSLPECSSFKPAGLMEPLTALTRLHIQDLNVNLPQLLQVLPLLQQLEVLLMRGNGITATGMPLNPCYDDFAAFTASSKLKQLEVQLDSTPLPPAAFAAMFGGSKQLTALTDLLFSAECDQARGLGTTELQAIVHSCPQLIGLTIRGCVQPDVDWSVLSDLHHLVAMDANPVSDGDAAKLASLVRLKGLVFQLPHTVTFAGIQKLTALTNLVRLDVPLFSSTSFGWLYSRGGADHVGGNFKLECMPCIHVIG
jgi:hypothetical protein